MRMLGHIITENGYRIPLKRFLMIFYMNTWYYHYHINIILRVVVSIYCNMTVHYKMKLEHMMLDTVLH